MKLNLSDIASLASGLYLKPGISANAMYLQTVSFNEFGKLDNKMKPTVNVEGRAEKHLLQEGDVLFAAKGTHDLACVYHSEYGLAVASSTFIVLRIKPDFKSVILPEYLAWYLSVAPEFGRNSQKQLGTTVSSVSIKKLSKLAVKIPKIEKQHLIIRVKKLHQQETEIMRSLEHLRNEMVQHMLLKSMTD